MLKIRKTLPPSDFCFFNGLLSNYRFFFINKKIQYPLMIKVLKKNKQLIFIGIKGKLILMNMPKIHFFLKRRHILLNSTQNHYNKQLINLNKKLIQLKIKGVLQEFKVNVNLNGIGYKINIQSNKLYLKIGFSHLIKILIPNQILIKIKSPKLVLYCSDLIYLTQFIYFMKKFKKIDPYKNKGLLLLNEKVIKKEGKKSKK